MTTVDVRYCPGCNKLLGSPPKAVDFSSIEDYDAASRQWWALLDNHLCVHHNCRLRHCDQCEEMGYSSPPKPTQHAIELLREIMALWNDGCLVLAPHAPMDAIDCFIDAQSAVAASPVRPDRLDA